nr:MAG TPA: hypothetical protein [Caudoviricetes sp.]
MKSKSQLYLNVKLSSGVYPCVNNSVKGHLTRRVSSAIVLSMGAR